MNRPHLRTFAAFTLIELLVVIAVISILAAILFPVFAQAREKARAALCLSNCKQMGSAVMMYAQDYDEAIVPSVMPVRPGEPREQASWTYRLQPYLRNGAPQVVGGKFQAHGVMLCPSYSDANLKRAFDNPACEGPGVFERLFPPTQVYATYGIIWVQGATVGSGTQQNPFWHYAGSGPWRGDFVTTRLPAVLRPAETALITDGFTGVTGGKQPGNYGVSVGCDGAEMHQGGTNLIFLDGHAKWIAGNSERYLKQRADGKWFVLYYTYDME